MSPTGERSDEGTSELENPLGPQERQTRISKAKIQRVKTDGPRTLQRRNRQRKPQRRNRQRKPQRRNHQRSCIFKNNFTEQLTDDEDEDSAPFSLESTKDANKQPLTPPIYHLPSPQDVLFPSLKHNEIKAKEGTKRMYFC
ncbi:hypothetical protein TNCV_4200681 [Trichonephila clavipes]|uniref:Uncharacterized protein n=1 Tax=Trichonephila clavipes TaxID=2585209 RepID=A0A8X7BIK3_TRICX|nr:hypothetical protein TNCV_4200681 [Trichonephila clavipes]